MTNLEIVRALYDAFGARDHHRLRTLMHPDIEWVQNPGFPGGRSHVGVDAVLDDVFGGFRREWAAWRVELTEWIDAGPTIIALGRYHGTHGATGRSMSADFAHVYRLADERIVRFQQFTDTAMVAAAAG